MRIAFVGCGYVADFYVSTLPNHPELELLGVTDIKPHRLRAFASHYGVATYAGLDELLRDPRIELVVNLTNPRSHYEVTRRCLEAGRHVYSEKPLATELGLATELVELAERSGLYLASAPCSLLGEAAQTLWKALRQEVIGQVRLVYAEMDDGMLHRMRYRGWISASGAPWPAVDEFEVGCTLEHAGYYLMWLPAFFGPAVSITSFSSCQIEDKLTDVPLRPNASDFSAACIRFASGVVARLTCSIVAPHDHRLRIFGDEGTLSLEDCWDYGAQPQLTRRTRLGVKLEHHPLLGRLAGVGPRRLPLVRSARLAHASGSSSAMDFARGVAAVARAAREKHPSPLSARYALHVNELVLAMQYPEVYGSPRQITSTFEPVEPMPWAR